MHTIYKFSILPSSTPYITFSFLNLVDPSMSFNQNLLITLDNSIVVLVVKYQNHCVPRFIKSKFYSVGFRGSTQLCCCFSHLSTTMLLDLRNHNSTVLILLVQHYNGVVSHILASLYC